MISIRFEDFMKQNYKDGDYVLYLSRDGAGEVLYVSMTNENAWDRWFHSPRAHIPINYQGVRFGSTGIGCMIIDNIPASYDWLIELWTIPDAVNYFKLGDAQMYELSSFGIRKLERKMIAHFKPTVNERA
jgi:hypothetical protein